MLYSFNVNESEMQKLMAIMETRNDIENIIRKTLVFDYECNLNNCGVGVGSFQVNNAETEDFESSFELCVFGKNPEDIVSYKEMKYVSGVIYEKVDGKWIEFENTDYRPYDMTTSEFLELGL